MSRVRVAGGGVETNEKIKLKKCDVGGVFCRQTARQLLFELRENSRRLLLVLRRRLLLALVIGAQRVHRRMRVVGRLYDDFCWLEAFRRIQSNRRRRRLIVDAEMRLQAVRCTRVLRRSLPANLSLRPFLIEKSKKLRNGGLCAD